MAKLTAALTRRPTEPLTRLPTAVVSTGGGSGPVSDPLFASVNATGWDGEASSTPPSVYLDKIGYVNFAGFDSSGSPTTYLDTVVMTKRKRQPAPNDSTLTATGISLSEWITKYDTPLGFTSASTLVAPPPVLKWAMAPNKVIGDAVRLRAVGTHYSARDGKMLACCIFSCTDGVTTRTQTVALPIVAAHSGDQCAVVEYICDFDTSSYADKTNLTFNVDGYPLFGSSESVRRSSAGTQPWDLMPVTFYKNAALLADPPCAVVSTSGNDGTGVIALTSNIATARATPFLTAQGALAAMKTAAGAAYLSLSGGIIDGWNLFLGANTVGLTAVPAAGTYNSFAAVRITRDPTVTRAQAVWPIGASTVGSRLAYMHFDDVTIERIGAGQLSGPVIFENVTFNNNSVNSAFLTSTGVLYMMGLTFNGGVLSSLSAGTNPQIRLSRGLVLTNNSVEARCLIGCKLINVKTSYNSVRTTDNTFVGFLTVDGYSDASNGFLQPISDASNTITGWAIVQVALAWITATAGSSMRPSGDSSSISLHHLCMHHITVAGYGDYGRFNALYNETSGVLRSHTFCSFIGNDVPQLNTKHDRFAQTQGLDQVSSRIGGWGFLHGTGCRDNVIRSVDANGGTSGTQNVSFSQEMAGLRALCGTTGAPIDPLYIDNRATTAGPVAGSVGGNYRPQAGSPLIGRNKRPAVPYDLDGVPRSLTASCVGAYERLAA